MLAFNLLQTSYAGILLTADLVCWHFTYCRPRMLAFYLLQTSYAGILLTADLVCWHFTYCRPRMLAFYLLQTSYAGILLTADLVCWHFTYCRPRMLLVSLTNTEASIFKLHVGTHYSPTHRPAQRKYKYLAFSPNCDTRQNLTTSSHSVSHQCNASLGHTLTTHIRHFI